MPHRGKIRTARAERQSLLASDMSASDSSSQSSSRKLRALSVLASLRTAHTFLLILFVVIVGASIYLRILHDRSQEMTAVAAEREVLSLLEGLQLAPRGAAGDVPSELPSGMKLRVLDS